MFNYSLQILLMDIDDQVTCLNVYLSLQAYDFNAFKDWKIRIQIHNAIPQKQKETNKNTFKKKMIGFDSCNWNPTNIINKQEVDYVTFGFPRI